MTNLVLIDTSSWVHALRQKGDATVRSRVQQLVLNGSAAWCDIIRLELWAGVRGNQERAGLNALQQSLPLLPINEEVWNSAVTYASLARAAGITAPANDLLVYACVKYHSCRFEHSDKHFDLLATLV